MSETPRVVSAEKHARGEPPSAGTSPPAANDGSPPRGSNPGGSSPPAQHEILESLHRIERILEETRGAFETSARAHHFHHFSLSRLSGALLQSLVILLIVFALSDWVYAASEGKQLVKLAFAGVLQLGALTAFLLAREE